VIPAGNERQVRVKGVELVAVKSVEEALERVL
jgi:hypothetical protein